MSRTMFKRTLEIHSIKFIIIPAIARFTADNNRAPTTSEVPFKRKILKTAKRKGLIKIRQRTLPNNQVINTYSTRTWKPTVWFIWFFVYIGRKISNFFKRIERKK